MQPVYVVKRLCNNLFLEALDKNAAEFVCMCPRMYQLQTAGLFQFPAADLMMGFKYTVTHSLVAICCVNKSPCVIPVGSQLTLKLIEADNLLFDGYTVTCHDAKGSLAPTAGDNFTYIPQGNAWLDIAHFEIPNLRGALQPVAVNTLFSRLWRNKIGHRDESWGLALVLGLRGRRGPSVKKGFFP